MVFAFQNTYLRKILVESVNNTLNLAIIEQFQKLTLKTYSYFHDKLVMIMALIRTVTIGCKADDPETQITKAKPRTVAIHCFTCDSFTVR